VQAAARSPVQKRLNMNSPSRRRMACDCGMKSDHIKYE